MHMENEINELHELHEAVPQYKYISQEEYLEMERAATEKHEYYKGHIYAMSGASPRHIKIHGNLSKIVYPSLRGKSCDMFGSDCRIHIPENTLYTYPDATIFCTDPILTVKFEDNFTNPFVIIEILSPSTKKYDRGTKFTLYKAIKSFREYILIDSTSVGVETFSRDANNTWRKSEFTKLTDRFRIDTIELFVEISELYDGITW